MIKTTPETVPPCKYCSSRLSSVFGRQWLKRKWSWTKWN